MENDQQSPLTNEQQPNNQQIETPENRQSQINLTQQTSSGQAEQTLTNSSLPKKTGKKWLLPLVVIVALALCALVYFAFKNFQLNKEQPISPTPTTNIPTPTIDPTVNWETYSNQKYGYIVKYPTDYSVLEESPEYVRFFPGANNTDLPQTETYLTIQLDNNTGQSEQSGVVYKTTPDGHTLRIVKIIMDTEEAQKPVVEKIFDQIISTFKFVGVGDGSISNWTSKKSTKCNVTFQVPPKEAPFYDIESGRYWQFEEYGASMFMFNTTSRVIYRAPDDASGSVLGDVEVICSQNSGNVNTEQLYTALKTQLESNNQNSADSINILTSRNDQKWGHDVKTLTFKGGMFNENQEYYFFSTSGHIYLVRKIITSEIQSIVDTADKIFDNLQFE